MSYNNLFFPLSLENVKLYGFLLLVLLIVAKIGHQLYKNRSNYRRLPPSPTKHWFWGNKEFLAQPYRHVLLGVKYKKELGDIISAVTPMDTTIYLNTMELATELLEKHASATSNRPRNVMTNEILGWGTSPAFRQHDEVHKKMRRVMASALHPAAARSYASQHLDMTLNFLRHVAANPASFLEYPNQTNGSFMIRLAYGYVAREGKDPLVTLVHDTVRYAGRSLTDYYLVNDFPILKYVPSWFPGAGFKRFGKKGYDMRTRYANETFNTVFEQVKNGQVERLSYVSGLLESKGGMHASESDIDLIKWTAASIFTAGTTTTGSLINAFFLMACLYPEVMQTAQAEIDSVVGRERIPNLQDRSSLPYTDAVLLEIMRMSPPAPLGVSHLATENIEFRGYQIPKGATINPNIWAILRDPNHFSSPHTFNPSRFLGPKPEPDPRKFIFGFGRRVCPGLHVANNGAWIMCAGLLSVFTIRSGPRFAAKVSSLGGRESERLYELTDPYGLTDPLPFDCEIKLRDSAAASVLDNST
ncbi:hypothetical protein OPQ81_001109 [Rhizoctonia solani]|nr:hypothetical protein OPQ81_001109 [Rhizoctonia solani]